MPVEFNANGLLPYGLHEYTLDEVVEQFTFTAERQWLLSELRKFIPQSSIAAASHELWIDGSYAETKPEPNDIDVLFVQHREKLTPEALTEIAKLSRPEFRERLKTHHGIDFNQDAVEDGFYPDLFMNIFNKHWDWSQADPQPEPKGIILVRL